MCLSVPQMAAAATRISTSPSAGSGVGTSWMVVPSGPSSGADLTTAFIGPRMLSRRFRELPGEAANRLDDRLRVALEEVTVLSAVDDHQPIPRRAAGFPQRLGHRVGAGGVVT